MKTIKKLIGALLTVALVIVAIWWSYSFDIESKGGNVLPHGDEGQVIIIRDDNPIFDFKILYDGPDFSKELSVKSGDYALVLFNAERKDLFVYSEPEQMTLRASSKETNDNFSVDDFSIWQLMLSNKAFFKYGSHTLTLTTR